MSDKTQSPSKSGVVIPPSEPAVVRVLGTGAVDQSVPREVGTVVEVDDELVVEAADDESTMPREAGTDV